MNRSAFNVETDDVASRGARFDRFAVGCLFAILFLSGAAALIFEISWAREIGLLIGNTAHSAAVVLTAYFAGMAIGSLLAAKIVRWMRPLIAFAAMECIAASWAFFLPGLLSMALSPEIAAQLQSQAPAAPIALRWLFCFVLLLPATAALGATLPLIADWLLVFDRRAALDLTSAYAVNTAGAFVGVVLATAWLLGNVGVTRSSTIAACLCTLGGAAAVSLDLVMRMASRKEPPANGPSSHTMAMGEWFGPSLVPVAISGFGILALEVLYARLFALVFHNSSYTFGAILAAVILSLALGPLLLHVLPVRCEARSLLAWVSAAGSLIIVASIHLFVALTRLEYFRWGDSFAAYLAATFAVVAVIVAPSMILFGMIVPLAWRIEADRRRLNSAMIGRTLFFNTFAGAAGAACTSLFLLPALGLWASMALVAAAFAFIAFVILMRRKRFWLANLLMTSTVLATATLIFPPGPERWAITGNERLVKRWHSAYGWIDVVEGKEGVLKVRQNLHYRYGSTGADAPRAYRQAHLPLLLHPQPADVLFLGLGTGLTAGAATHHAEVKRGDIVELIPEVVDAARFLRAANFGIVDHPRFTVTIDDARHFLLATNRRFDVIISDLFVPWESETGYLYTVEHFQAARRRLKPGGLFCQWLPIYQMGPRELELIADSFASVFPETSLWWGHINARSPILALVGSEGRLNLNAKEIDARLGRLYKTAPTDDDLKSAQELVGNYLGHWRPPQSAMLNTDEFPRVEFLTPLSERNGSLLHDENLRNYYDSVLAHLPDRSEQFSVELEPPATRRTWHRLFLFPR